MSIKTSSEIIGKPSSQKRDYHVFIVEAVHFSFPFLVHYCIPINKCGIVLQGQIEMFIGDEQKILTPNETYFIPSSELHGWKTFDNSVKLLDISLKQD